MRPVKNIFTKKLEGNLPGELLKLHPKEITDNASPLALFQEKPDIQFGINKKQLLQIKSWKEVESLHRSQILQRPVFTHLKHPLLTNLGGGLKFDILMQGVEPSLIKPYLSCMKNFKPQKKKIGNNKFIVILPVVIPEIYMSIAQVWLSVNNLPMIKIGAFNGINLNMLVGRIILKPKAFNKGTRILGKICGFVPEGLVTTLGVPLKWVEKYHKSQNMYLAANSYNQIFVRIKNFKDVNKIKNRVKKFGLISHSQTKKYDKLMQWITKIDYIFWAIAFILIILSGISLINSFALLTIEKKYEFGLYVIFGSSSIFIWVMMFIEGVIWGCIHAFLSLKIAKTLFSYFKENFTFTATYSEWSTLNFSLSFQEQLYLIVATILFTGFSSMIPAIILTKNKTINMIKKN